MSLTLCFAQVRLCVQQTFRARHPFLREKPAPVSYAQSIANASALEALSYAFKQPQNLCAAHLVQVRAAARHLHLILEVGVVRLLHHRCDWSLWPLLERLRLLHGALRVGCQQLFMLSLQAADVLR